MDTAFRKNFVKDIKQHGKDERLLSRSRISSSKLKMPRVFSPSTI